MNTAHAAAAQTPDNGAGDDNTINPLPGELGIPDVAAPRKAAVSKKGIVAVALLVLSVLTVSAFAIQRFAASGRNTDAEDKKLVREKPTAAAAETRKLEMPAQAPGDADAQSGIKVPAISATDDEVAEPIGVRRTGAGPQGGSSAKAIPPEDAPILLVSARPGSAGLAASTRQPTPGIPAEPAAADTEIDPNDPMAATTRNLQGYQRQLQGLLDNLTNSAELATAGPSSSMQSGPLPTFPTLPSTAGAVSTATSSLLGGQLQGSSTPKVPARHLGNRSLTLPKGTAFTCALKTRIISAASGLVGCQVQRNVFSDDGRVLLIERGSHLDGEYRITSVRPGAVRIPVLWTRVRTPLGVTVDIESPATGKLGESGIDGHVDNRWFERIGAAMLLSLIDDSVKLAIQNQSNERQGDTIVLPSTTANTSKLAEKVLDSTINIPPLIYQNQGGIVGIYVARDVDFSAVYELVPTSVPTRER